MPRLQFIPIYQLAAAVVVAILYLTLFPDPFGEEELPLFPGADKVAHFCMFGGLCGTIIYERWRFCIPLSLRQALWVAVAVSIFGCMVEWLQAAMQLGRSGNDWMDALANAAGAFCAVPVGRWLHWVNVLVDDGSRK